MAGLEARKLHLWHREQEIIKELTTLEAGLDEAIITGSQQSVQESINTLKTELANVQRERYAVTNPPRNGILGDLVKAVWTETADQIRGPLRDEWDEKLTELNQAKAMFLKAVAELGEIKRRADSLTSWTTEMMFAVPGLKMAVPSLSTGLIMRPDRKEGPIYINHLEIEKHFNGRK